MRTHRHRLVVLIAGFAFFLLLLCISGFLVQSSQSAQAKSARWVAHTVEVEARIAGLLAMITEAEASARGYLLTHRDPYLEPYEKALPQVGPALADLQQVTKDNAAQQQRLSALAPLIEKKREVMEKAVTHGRAGKFDEAVQVINTDLGRNLMDSIRKLTNELAAEESRLLKIREVQLQADATHHAIESWLLTLLGAAGGGAVLYLLIRLQKLERLVTVCAWSKTINYKGEWLSFETYLHRHFGVEITHGISPNEAVKLQRAFDEDGEKKGVSGPAAYPRSPS